MSVKHDDNGGYPRDCYPTRASRRQSRAEFVRGLVDSGSIRIEGTFLVRRPFPEDPRSLSRDELVRRALRARR